MQLSILDFICLGAMLLFALWGAKKGLVLSLCSLVALLVALVGASLITDALAPALAKQAAPLVEGFITENLEAILAGQAGEQTGFLWGFVRQAVENSQLVAEAAGEFAAQLAVQVTGLILRPILFALAFGLVLIAWFFISHALDLVAKLPVLSTLNHAGGLVFGAVEGAVLALVALLLVRAFAPDLIPPAWMENSFLLRGLESLSLPPLF